MPATGSSEPTFSCVLLLLNQQLKGRFRYFLDALASQAPSPVACWLVGWMVTNTFRFSLCLYLTERSQAMGCYIFSGKYDQLFSDLNSDIIQ